MIKKNLKNYFSFIFLFKNNKINLFMINIKHAKQDNYLVDIGGDETDFKIFVNCIN